MSCFAFDKWFSKRSSKYGVTKDGPSWGDCRSAWAACKREVLKILKDDSVSGFNID